MNDITAEEIRSFLVTVRADRAAKTVNLYRGALYTFFSRALQNGLLKANPVIKFIFVLLTGDMAKICYFFNNNICCNCKMLVNSD